MCTASYKNPTSSRTLRFCTNLYFCSLGLIPTAASNAIFEEDKRSHRISSDAKCSAFCLSCVYYTSKHKWERISEARGAHFDHHTSGTVHTATYGGDSSAVQYVCERHQDRFRCSVAHIATNTFAFKRSTKGILVSSSVQIYSITLFENICSLNICTDV